MRYFRNWKKKKVEIRIRVNEIIPFAVRMESFIFFISSSTKFPINTFLIKMFLIFCHLNIGTMRLSPTPWKLVSCSIKQYQSFLSIKGPWDTERLLCKFDLGYSDKIRSDKKRFAANLINYTWRVKKLHVILIFTVGYHWLDKLVNIV